MGVGDSSGSSSGELVGVSDGSSLTGELVRDGKGVSSSVDDGVVVTEGLGVDVGARDDDGVIVTDKLGDDVGVRDEDSVGGSELDGVGVDVGDGTCELDSLGEGGMRDGNGVRISDGSGVADGITTLGKAVPVGIGEVGGDCPLDTLTNATSNANIRANMVDLLNIGACQKWRMGRKKKDERRSRGLIKGQLSRYWDGCGHLLIETCEE